MLRLHWKDYASRQVKNGSNLVTLMQNLNEWSDIRSFTFTLKLKLVFLIASPGILRFSFKNPFLKHLEKLQEKC